jgi:hypothetical protein
MCSDGDFEERPPQRTFDKADRERFWKDDPFDDFY